MIGPDSGLPSSKYLCPEELHEFITHQRDNVEAFDIVIPQMRGTGDVDADRARMTQFSEAGATWVLDAGFPAGETLEDLLARVRRGPPRIGA